MPKRTPRNTLKPKVFRIYRITGKGNQYVTSLKAPSGEAAIKAHVEDREITDAYAIKRLVALQEP
jgi:hypothetical protein